MLALEQMRRLSQSNSLVVCSRHRKSGFGRMLAPMLLAVVLAQAMPAAAQAAPVLVGAAARKVHGAAGVFDLPLAPTPSNPTTEPRLGPAHAIVFTFDSAVTGGTPTLTEGTATVGTPTFSGNELIVPLTAVGNGQYLTLTVANVSAAGGGTGGSGSVRVGFLAGDVNQSRAVTLSDLGLINAQLAQPVTVSNYALDVNASGTLTLADKGIVNANLTHVLPPPVETAPSVIATVPSPNATNVSPGANLTVQFSEPVTVSGNWFQIVCTSGTHTPANTAVSGDAGANSGTTFTLNPNADLAPGDACTMTVFANAISDNDAIDPPDSMLADYAFGFTVRAIGGLFEKALPWNKDVSALSPSSRSAAIIAALQGFGGWGNGNKLQIDFSIAVLNADSSTPRRTITGTVPYCYNGPDCDTVPLQMPLPVNGNTEGSADYVCDRVNNDCHVLVVERSEKKLYELYNATQSGSSFIALGAFVWDLTKQYPDVLRGDQCTSADAAGLPMAALIPTADEVAAGDVPHALRFILPNARMKKQVYVRPATHAGGPSSTNPNAPPYGVRFRLKASFDETPYNANARVILRAMKKYGMILSDGGNIALTFADDRLATAKWSALGIVPQTFNSIGVGNFDVVDLSAEIPLTYDCVRAP
jgi:hypothetical protein